MVAYWVASKKTLLPAKRKKIDLVCPALKADKYNSHKTILCSAATEKGQHTGPQTASHFEFPHLGPGSVLWLLHGAF